MRTKIPSAGIAHDAPIGAQGVQADVDPVQASSHQGRSVPAQKRAIGGHGQIVDTGDGGDHAHQVLQIEAGQGFATGEAHLGDAQLGGR